MSCICNFSTVSGVHRASLAARIKVSLLCIQSSIWWLERNQIGEMMEHSGSGWHWWSSMFGDRSGHSHRQSPARMNPAEQLLNYLLLEIALICIVCSQCVGVLVSRESQWQEFWISDASLNVKMGGFAFGHPFSHFNSMEWNTSAAIFLCCFLWYQWD